MTMKEKKSVFDYAAQALMIFGLMVFFHSVCSYLSGPEGKDVSSLFSLGKQGLSMDSLAQLFGLSVLITVMRALFFSGRFFKKTSATVRTLGMVISGIAIIVVFVIVFDWFPAGDILPWVLFALSFGICFAVSFALTLFKQKRENEALADALARLKDE